MASQPPRRFDTGKLGGGSSEQLDVGTLNHKPECGPEPRPVTWLVRPDEESLRSWEPAELARVLDLAWPVESGRAARAAGRSRRYL